MEEAFDLVILGSGSTAFAAALRAQELGRTAVMTESRTLGGTCVSRGCLPSKNLIEAARVYWNALHPCFPGLRPQGMEVDFPALVRQKNQLVEAYREKLYTSLVRESDRIRSVRGTRTVHPRWGRGSGRAKTARAVTGRWRRWPGEQASSPPTAPTGSWWLRVPCPTRTTSVSNTPGCGPTNGASWWWTNTSAPPHPTCGLRGTSSITTWMLRWPPRCPRRCARGDERVLP